VKLVTTGRLVYLAIAGALLYSLHRLGLLDPGQLRPAAANLSEFFREMFPPNPDVLETLIEAMGETIEIAFVGTLLGFLLSLPLAFLATRTLFGPVVNTGARLVIGMVRTIPSLLWAIIFVIGFGLGPAAGALGIALYTTGYLGKLYYESFEAVDGEVLEAVSSVTKNRAQLLSFAIIPESANAIISQLLFMFEYNIRASSIMGFVGAGGIGFYILGYIQLLQYDNLLTALLVTFVVVMIIDYLSMRVRELVVSGGSFRRARAPLTAGLIP
jgi:phosphonate transport system permease protein